MKGLNIKKTAWLAVALCLLGSVLVYQAARADGKSATIRVNRIFGGVKDDGGVGQFSFGSSWWTADYDNQGNSMENGDGVTGSYITMAATNWTDPNGKLIPKAVIRSIDVYTMTPAIVTKAMTNYFRWPLPVYKVNSTSAQISLEAGAAVDPTKMVGNSDQTVTVTGKNAMGVEIQRKLFAFSQNFHDNYIVCDLVLTNKSGKTLTDFYAGFYSGDISYIRRANGSNPSIPGADAVNAAIGWHHYYGAKPGDSLRVYYEYHADDPTRSGDQMHGAMLAQDGRLYEYNVQFYTIVHASKEPYTDASKDVDDPIQPRVTYCYAEFPMNVNPLWSKAEGRDLLYDLMSGQKFTTQQIPGETAGTSHRANSDEQGSPDWSILGEGFSDGSIWNRRFANFGPYPNFKDGESIHIVYATGFAGIGIQKAREIGMKLKAGTLTDAPNLPNAATGYFPSNFAFASGASELDKMADRWISTGIDSMLKSCSRIKWNFKHKWLVPMAPQPPNREISGFGDGVEIKWSASQAEALDNFAGYRIMRRISRYDTVFFDNIYQTGASDKAAEHTFKDKNILFGASYFYYVQSAIKIAADDANADPISRGKIVWSGRMWQPTTTEVQPPRPPQSDLSKIRIVPNPYNLRDPLLTTYGWTGDRGIMFYNLPEIITISIYTESGDLVRILEHNNPQKTGYEYWNMVTQNQQAVQSGVYIAVFKTPEGELVYQKFCIVR
jgi:hypothetical protein